MVATDNVQKTPPEEATLNLAVYLKERQKLCDTAL
ncbi:MAG: polyprenyl synthetase family protein, partial [Nostoc sp.]